MDGMTVRAARLEDIERILEIAGRAWNTTYGEFLSRETIDTAMTEWYDPDATREYIRREDVAYLVAEDGESIVGYLNGGSTEKENVAKLGAIYVDPDHWGNGAGTSLLAEFEAFCRHENYDRIRLHVFTENEVGRSFYEKHGYEMVEKRETEIFGESTYVRVCARAIDDDSNHP